MSKYEGAQSAERDCTQESLVDEKNLNVKIAGIVCTGERAKLTYNDIADQILAYATPIIEAKYKEVLEFARGAIGDAICCEDGLDRATGAVMIKWITDLLGDSTECQETKKGKGII